MKITLISLLSLSLFSLVNANEWKILGKDINGKKSPVLTLVNEPKLLVSASISEQALSIRLSDGKQKFGAANIEIKKGDTIYKRPRLSLDVDIDKVKAVKKGSSLQVCEFSYKGTDFVIKLVQGGNNKLPDIEITKI